MNSYKYIYIYWAELNRPQRETDKSIVVMECFNVTQ